MKRLEVYLRWKLDYQSVKEDVINITTDLGHMAETHGLKIKETKWYRSPGPEFRDEVSTCVAILEEE